VTAAQQYVASSQPMSICSRCGIYYVGLHTCGGYYQPLPPSPWPMPEAEIDRIARRVVDLLREERKEQP
jgi:hypothetical protein